MLDAAGKIAFVSPHCILDFTNGAATATRDGLRVLAEMRFECSAFCGTRLDDPQEGLLQESLFRRGVKYEVRKAKIPAYIRPSAGGPHPGPLPDGEGTWYEARLIFAVDGALPVTIFENASTRGGWLNVHEAQAFLTACEIFLGKNRPDVVVTYGGDPASIAVQRIAKRLGITVVFWLHNFAYSDRSAFEAVDRVIVPSEFSRRYYRERLGLDCHILPNIVNWEAAEVIEHGAGSIEQGAGASDQGTHDIPLPEGKGTKVAGTGHRRVALVGVPSALRSQPQDMNADEFRSLELPADGTPTNHPDRCPVPATMSGGTRSVPATLEKAATRQDESGDKSPHSKFVTFINPHPVKGVYVFARIARELARRRPDIPILVTPGRSRTDALLTSELGLAELVCGELRAGGKSTAAADRCAVPAAPERHGVHLERHRPTSRVPRRTLQSGKIESGDKSPHSKTITTMPFTPDPRKFYPAVFSKTKLLLMPSLWLESFGLVAAEAMLNGIPVLAGNRGALAETVGESPHPNPLPKGEGTNDPHPNPFPGTISPHPNPLPEGEGTSGLPEGEGTGGFLFDIPARYTSASREVPSAEEVEPWVETIIRLWDDQAEYERASQAARDHARQWRPERLKPLYREFFTRISRSREP